MKRYGIMSNSHDSWFVEVENGEFIKYSDYEKNINQFISVNDSLPDLHKTVLTFSDRGIKMNHLVIKEKYKTIWNGCDKITHWMPLPEPPK